MTSDAKVGLLLGLVFIFIIAFVINGLPRFRSAVNNGELTTNMVGLEDSSLGIAEREREAQDTLNWQQFENSGPIEQQPLATDTTTDTDYSTLPSSDIPLSGNVEYESSTEWQPSLSGSGSFDDLEEPQTIRFTLPLTPNPFREELSPSRPSYFNNEVQTGRWTEPSAGALQDTQPLQKRPKEPEPTKPAQIQSYTVQEGDSLSEIAKKFYGQQEGNRLVNINRIFEANRNILESPDDIAVGQELIIPSLSSTADTNQAGEIFSGPQFERVESIGRTGSDTGRWYTVKEDDSLWKIAAEQLGRGSRYKEIIELNSDRLTDEDRLDPGQRLRLPAR